MVSPIDTSYQETKQIMLGNASIKQEFRPLIDWINEVYGVKPINIIYEYVDVVKRPRLEICFEFDNEISLFMKNKLFFDDNKGNAILDKFRQLLQEKYDTENMFVIFGNFSKVAKEDINNSIAKSELEKLKNELNDSNLWAIDKCFSIVTFFLFTNTQVQEYKNSDILNEWKDRYFNLLKKYDVFGYFRKEEFSILLDSKENFDTKYKSNWFYYYR